MKDLATKTMLRVDERLRAGLKRVAIHRNMPLYVLVEKIMWDWLALNEPDIARQAYDWKAPRSEELEIKPPIGAVQFVKESTDLHVVDLDD
jgi:hypothetical protein